MGLRLVRHGQRKCSLGKEKCAKYFLVEKYFVEKNLGKKKLVQKTMLVVLFPLLCLTLGAPASVLNKQGDQQYVLPKLAPPINSSTSSSQFLLCSSLSSLPSP